MAEVYAADRILPQDSHAPEGYGIYRQFFDGETAEEALRSAKESSGCHDTQISPGHYTPEIIGIGLEIEWTWHAHGWMTFLPVDYSADDE